jgi:hypothetical protein
LRAADRDTLIATYLRHTAERRHEDAWAFDAVGNLAGGKDAQDAWELVVELLRRTPDEHLGYVAAGPLEDMLNRHAPALVEWIEGEARRDERFRRALGCIWMRGGELPPDIERRVVAASGGEIVLLP